MGTYNPHTAGLLFDFSIDLSLHTFLKFVSFYLKNQNIVGKKHKEFQTCWKNDKVNWKTLLIYSKIKNWNALKYICTRIMLTCYASRRVYRLDINKFNLNNWSISVKKELPYFFSFSLFSITCFKICACIMFCSADSS